MSTFIYEQKMPSILGLGAGGSVFWRVGKNIESGMFPVSL